MGFSYVFSYGFSPSKKGIHRLTINNRLQSDPMAISSHLGDGIGFFASGKHTKNDGTNTSSKRQTIYKWVIIHSYVSLLEGDWKGFKPP